MRTTSDPKDSTVKVRLNEEMSRYLSETAAKRGESVSSYLRELIRRDMMSEKPTGHFKLF